MRASWLVLVTAVACEHPRPYAIQPPEPPPPRTGPFPLQITFGSPGEWNPEFSADARDVMFSYEIPERADRDRCLSWVPRTGGWATRSLCWRGAAERDSTDAVVTGAESPGGRVAFIAERGGTFALFPNERLLLIADAPGAVPVAVLRFPYLGSVSPWNGARDLTWSGDSLLAFVALSIVYKAGRPGEPPDTLITGIEIARIDVRGATPAIQAYAGTRYASSVAAGPAPGTVIFTLGGDARVYTLDLATGAQSVLYDFSTAGLHIVRDAGLAGRVLCVVGDGVVAFNADTALGFNRQADQGGQVYAVDLDAGTAPLVLAPIPLRFFRHLAVSEPAGLVVAEGHAVNITARFPNVENSPIDTIVAGGADLYLLPVP